MGKMSVDQGLDKRSAAAHRQDLSDVRAASGGAIADMVRRFTHPRNARSPAAVVSLLAALAGARVSAAATELTDSAADPLAGLAPVDDLSGFGEICLPGEAYGYDRDHDHDARAHANGAGHGAEGWRHGDPFASRFVNRYSRAHDGHEDHAAHGAGGRGAHAHHETGPGSHSGGHDQASHQNHASHFVHASHQALHQTSHQAGGGQHLMGAGDGHGNHPASASGDQAHDGRDHEAGGHAAGSAHAAHAAHAPMQHEEQGAQSVPGATDAAVLAPVSAHDHSAQNAAGDGANDDGVSTLLAEIDIEDDEMQAAEPSGQHDHAMMLSMMEPLAAEDLGAVTPPLI